ncbi:histone-lysine N-methyltransferase SETMAR [Trichonephila clavipes]|uniref:Histone-lysine N-methyltransferase SETMAR n=1 Tax=Trichonephila clavipes TaxID=2585209 RepID=A0A8X6VP31_TRICX|nr:histone-lysine N-methyltransferase SETMAR [Trichonephila clavipes]
MESETHHFRHILLFYYSKGKNAVQARKKSDAHRDDLLTVRQSHKTALQNFCPTIVMLKMHYGLGGQLKLIKLLPDNTTFNEMYCCHQLNQLNESLEQKKVRIDQQRKGVVFHQGNAKLHISLVTRQNLLQLEWDILQQSQYSPDLAFSACRGAMHVKFVESSKSSRWYGVVVRGGGPPEKSSSSLDRGSKLRDPRKPQRFAYGKSVYFCVDFLNVGAINATLYSDTLAKLKEAIWKKWPQLLKSGILLLNDNATPHWVTEKQNHIAILCWESLHYPPYSPDLATSDFHLFPTLKKNFAGRPFGSNVEVKQALKCFFRMQSPEFFLEGFSKFIKRYRTVACFVTGSSPVPLKTRRVGQRCTLNLSRAETSSRWCGVVVRRGGASSGVVHVT